MCPGGSAAYCSAATCALNCPSGTRRSSGNNTPSCSYRGDLCEDLTECAQHASHSRDI